jgi:hypothetical protein
MAGKKLPPKVSVLKMKIEGAFLYVWRLHKGFTKHIYSPATWDAILVDTMLRYDNYGTGKTETRKDYYAIKKSQGLGI